MNDTPEIIDNPDANRFEIHADGATAFLTYRMNGDAMEYLHSETPAELRGRGYAGELVKFALDGDRIAGRKVIPTCPFVKSYIEKHPEYAPFVLAN